jgi:hypothetical protein
MPSTENGSSPSPRPARDLRDSWLFRGAVLVVALLVAAGVARGCGSAGRNVTKDEAIAIARASVPVEPEKVQVRFIQQGIPPQPVWAVSLYDLDAAGHPINPVVVIVNATTGKVVEP